jgi:hypothetical protein
MTTQSLSSVASNIVGQYSKAGKQILGAYRSGAQKLVSGASTRYVSMLKSGALPLVTDDLKARLANAQSQISGFVAGGLSVSIERVAAVSDRVQDKLDTQAITKVGNIAILPVARISLMLATRAVVDTKRLSDRVTDVPLEAAPVVAKSKRVVNKAVRKVKARA